jgi:rare lipoprotein A (peptidoglycan hydrolase)
MKYSQAALASLLAGLVAGCSTLPTGYSSRSKASLEDLFTSDENVVANNNTRTAPINDSGLRIKKSERGNMKSYVVRGQRYHTMGESDGYSARGLASWYGPNFHGQTASNGETYDMYKMTAAHKTLPLPTYVRVTHIDNGKSVVVKINDRGPFSGDRLIDLSFAAALQLGMVNDGTAMVDIEALTAQEVADLSGPDNSWGVEFYTDESVVANNSAAPQPQNVAVLESEQLPPVPATPAVTTDNAVVAVPAADVNPVAVAEETAEEVAEEQGELLSLDGLKEEMQAQNSTDTEGAILPAESQVTEQVAQASAQVTKRAAVQANGNAVLDSSRVEVTTDQDIQVAVNAELTSEVRKAAGLPVDLIDNAGAGQPVSLSSIGAVQTAKTETPAVQPVEAATAQAGEAVELPKDLNEAAAAAPAAEAGGPGYYIQAGVFADVKDAEKVAVDVVLAVPLEEVHVKTLKGTEMYRITVGPIIAADHAAEVSGKLEDAGVDNFTVKVKSIQQ